MKKSNFKDNFDSDGQVGLLKFLSFLNLDLIDATSLSGGLGVVNNFSAL